MSSNQITVPKINICKLKYKQIAICFFLRKKKFEKDVLEKELLIDENHITYTSRPESIVSRMTGKSVRPLLYTQEITHS